MSKLTKKIQFTHKQLRLMLAITDGIFIVVSALLAHWMIAYNDGSAAFSLPWWILLWAGINVLVGICIFRFSGMYTMVHASIGFPELVRIILAVFGLFFLNVIAATFTRGHAGADGIGYSKVVVFSLLLATFVVGVRFSKRAYRAIVSQILSTKHEKKRVMIIGCNNNGFILLRNMLFTEKSAYKAVCFLDNDTRNIGKKLYDIRVVGSIMEAPMFAKQYKIDEIFITLNFESKEKQKEVLQICKECGCPIKMLPELAKLTDGEVTAAKLKPVKIEDLLGRDQVSVNLAEVMAYIENKVILVTGGGGSIGSELCRQIALHSPKRLIILDIYENGAYDIEQELRYNHPDLDLLVLIASIRDENKVKDVFEKYRPQIVFNAAAHKHVPLMETSPNEAVKNNVFGTWNVATAAEKYGTEVFVQISTDKAVNPTNIMGATKRICEMIIQSIGRNSKTTKFVAVRFGNVLGSNGSVIPLFKKQIEAGGPVTVTHKDIIRYFMTIPEAVSLVLQAGAYAQGGQIFVLDMGEPVRIYDLAYNLIKLSGLEPNVDIEIKITGLRPGEKLYEERLMDEEGLQKTANGLISIAQPIPFDETNFRTTLSKLYDAAYSETDQMKEWVKNLVPTYTIDKRESVALSYLKKETSKEIAVEESKPL